jgi:hypothetical protein
MRMMMFFRRKRGVSTAFSEFIRNASAKEKKRVYTDVLKKATEKQNAVAHREALSPK